MRIGGVSLFRFLALLTGALGVFALAAMLGSNSRASAVGPLGPYKLTMPGVASDSAEPPPPLTTCPALPPGTAAVFPCEFSGRLWAIADQKQGNYLAQYWSGQAYVRFRLKSVSDCPGCSPPLLTYNYELVESNSFWEVLGNLSSCTYSRTGTGPLASTSSLSITRRGSSAPEYWGSATVVIANRNVCPGPNTGDVIWNQFQISCLAAPEGRWPHSGSGPLYGQCVDVYKDLLGTGRTETYRWLLNPVSP